MIQLQTSTPQTKNRHIAVLITNPEPDYAAFGFSAQDLNIVKLYRDAKRQLVSLYTAEGSRFVHHIEPKAETYKNLEAARKAGATLAAELRNMKLRELEIQTDGNAELLLAYAEGLALGSYQFEKYKAEKQDNSLQQLFITHSDIDAAQVKQLQSLIDGMYCARNLVNEPGGILTAEKLAESIKALGKECGFQTEIFNKKKIEALKMGGLLAVNAGSIDPPTFSIMEYKPANAVNSQPLVFVGKGVTFDTGGLTLKPTPGSMDLMKSDMGGAAAVIGLFVAAAKAELPVHIIGLIPSTDNRPGEMAIFPGDVITMYDGTTVEVLNTDAEGRLILADALTYAKKYNPELVVDLATLTGAAARAVGQYAIIYMGTANEQVKQEMENSGYRSYERLVELPLWDEYGELIKSDIADLKNVSSGASAGAITAGKFLEHFTAYPWLHFDIAGSAFITSPDSYRGKNATGAGIRLLFEFLKNRTHSI